jgi:DNA-binding transcriptional LysR family regulator
MLPLNLIYLKYFSDAVRFGSVSASAKHNFVSQSAVSQAISKLENALKIALIEHHPNRLRITHEGQRVFEKSLSLFDEIKSLEASLQTEEGAGQVDFACTHSFALALLPKKLKEAKKRFPKIQLNFRLGHPGLIMDMLKKGLIDFGIVLDNEDLSDFESREIYSGEHKLYIAKSIKNPDNLPFILSEERMETKLLKQAYRQKKKQELKTGMEVFSWEAIAGLTEEGLGIGFFPDYIAYRRPKLKEHPLKFGSFPYKLFAILPKGRVINQNIKSFIDLLTQ